MKALEIYSESTTFLSRSAVCTAQRWTRISFAAIVGHDLQNCPVPDVALQEANWQAARHSSPQDLSLSPDKKAVLSITDDHPLRDNLFEEQAVIHIISFRHNPAVDAYQAGIFLIQM